MAIFRLQIIQGPPEPSNLSMDYLRYAGSNPGSSSNPSLLPTTHSSLSSGYILESTVPQGYQVYIYGHQNSVLYVYLFRFVLELSFINMHVLKDLFRENMWPPADSN